jgi:hypothetical protein
MSDDIRVRVDRPQFRYDSEQYTEGDELDVEPRVLERHPNSLACVDKVNGTDDADDADAEFDAAAFVARTPMGDVVENLETGEYDDHLDAIEAAADRKGVLETVADRRE